MERILRDDADYVRQGDCVQEELCISLQVLAIDAQAQVAHFPPVVIITNDMLLGFNHWAHDVHTYWRLSQEEEASLKALHAFFHKTSGVHNRSFLEDEALFTDSRWEEVRTLAKAALAAFGWPVKVPPPAEYLTLIDDTEVILRGEGEGERKHWKW
jgi:hypothetical protein